MTRSGGADGYGGGGGGGWTGANQFGGKGGSGTVILVFRQTDLGGWRLRG